VKNFCVKVTNEVFGKLFWWPLEQLSIDTKMVMYVQAWVVGILESAKAYTVWSCPVCFSRCSPEPQCSAKYVVGLREGSSFYSGEDFLLRYVDASL